MSKFLVAIKLLNSINELGYKAFIVGGALRSYLLNEDAMDIDITSNINIDILYSNYNVISNNNSNKFYSFIIIYEDYEFDITLFRYDISYYKNRFPVVILTNDLKKDQRRRDFTINQIYLDKDYKLYDSYNGINDFKNKKIKTILNSKKKFKQDPVRMLRCIYFSLLLDFKIDSNTKKYLKKYSFLLSELSYERLKKEFDKIFNLKKKKVYDYLKLINFTKNFNNLAFALSVLRSKNVYELSFKLIVMYQSILKGRVVNILLNKNDKKFLSNLIENKNKDLNRLIDYLKENKK